MSAIGSALASANLVNIFNPEMIIFGGSLRDVYLASAAQVRGRLNKMCVQAVREHVRLRTAALGEDAELLGAAELAFERLLTDPLEVANGERPRNRRRRRRRRLSVNGCRQIVT